jgi:hypothetical protein
MKFKVGDLAISSPLCSLKLMDRNYILQILKVDEFGFVVAQIIHIKPEAKNNLTLGLSLYLKEEELQCLTSTKKIKL